MKRDEPILTDADIESYCWDSQVVELTPEGARKWNAAGGWETPLQGLPLVVEVDGEPRYGAYLWNPLSSRGCALPQFWCWSRDDRLRLGGIYITAERDTIRRENFDPMVRRAMAEMGKLSEDCGDP